MAVSDIQESYPKVLLIDDDLISREVLALVLETYGFPIESAADGPEALEMIDKTGSDYELILMDTQMPGLSGVDLIAALRGKTLARIVAISGSPVSDSILTATDGFLLKPIEAATLIAFLRNESSVVEASTSANPAETVDLIDPAVLAKLKAMMSAAAVEEIYAAVSTDLSTRLDTLKIAMDAGDPSEVAKIAHAIKGGCAMVGLSSATAAAARLENSDAPETWPKELLQLRDAHIALQSILDGRLLK
jgi:CheY-like chemotaxis protein